MPRDLPRSHADPAARQRAMAFPGDLAGDRVAVCRSVRDFADRLAPFDVTSLDRRARAADYVLTPDPPVRD